MRKLVQLLILADVLLESVVNSRNGPIFLPVDKMTVKQKEDVSNLVKSHLENMMKMFRTIEPSMFDASLCAHQLKDSPQRA